MSRRLITAIDIDGAGGHPAAWRGAEVDPAAILTGELALRAVQRAEAAGVDFATFVDTLEAPVDEPERVSARLDALGLAARIAPATDRIGLVPTLTVTHTEPFHVQASVATLDYVSSGRAGWLAEVSSSEEAAAVIGRRAPAAAAETWREARYVVDVSRRLWDSWEDDAIIRDAATGRFVDRDRIHYVDYESPSFSIKGPSIVPRPPQGHPLTVVRVSSPEALQAAADADVVLLPGSAELAEQLAAVREAASTTPKVLLSVSVLLDEDTASAVRRADGAEEVDHIGGVQRLADLIGEWAAQGVDGIHLRPASLELDVPVIAERLLPLLRERKLIGPATSRPTTLRNRLGLQRPTNRCAVGSKA
ncbi:alkanesulfonate monooxygenase SsuD/methylene tetrahydromethanopterin reductase-like flavin-dependent oxidoreductase (luciferase family) [Kribbella orskensis]|uniref:Alkanesulfonate monooxygenase SsuD/methylene tetrahydromethanopterin reductase-like flavin-dependent oxidoreductase (Luciferase family) n=1 Tax=Kribbella orskensis TaxID=2512216 RepID=A0ABY2BML1_9ACTN|nr:MULTISPECIES: LLM class flavin-dependent oxidoreductase [Kribbella]TCN40541.1 alkanesulfonate monooxygenase SsuD/methylene tetrahydromethanopterin reductase-like flavin-dependent oxidoreductase (luciferase family) [Kribbella sp. VKM Ac-2500]TCO23161.1 alkanesulfonate monooxygenase SsuD/methylene tetrahydromethanopterin reductase-like flavin-dependent oxidoreductase (luciferase family) [Kribbella orskensis]